MKKKPSWRKYSSCPMYIKSLFFSTSKIWRESLEIIYKLIESETSIDRQDEDEFLHKVLEISYDSLNQIDDHNFQLERLERIFPIPLMFISPRKHAIVIYSIYRSAVGIKNQSENNMATYEEFASYLYKSDFTDSDYRNFYIFYYTHLNLLKLATPFRLICGLETGQRHYKNKQLISDEIKEKIIQLFCFPSGTTSWIQKMMENSGFEVALASVYKIARLSESIGKMLKLDKVDNKIILEIERKIETIMEWYEDYFIRKEEETKDLVILSKAHMSDRNICIAGIFGKGNWGRILYHSEKLPISILKEKGVRYFNFDIIRISLLHCRSIAPHIEDYAANWNRPPRVIHRVLTRDRERFLAANCENSIILKESQNNGFKKVGEVLERIDRSLVLIGPVNIDFVLFKSGIIKKFQARMKYSLPNSDIQSDDTISCTDIYWRKFGLRVLSKFNLNQITFSNEDLNEIFGIEKVFLVVGLSRKYRGRYWELIVGVHTIPDISIILKELTSHKTNKALRKFLRIRRGDFVYLYSNIQVDIGQRNLSNSIKRTIYRILKNFEDEPSESIFRLIGLYENLLREYIKNQISKKTPKQWYRKHIETLFDKNKIGKIDSKFKKDEIKECKHIYDHPNPLIYTNLEDLSYIIDFRDDKRNYRQKYFNQIDDIILHYMRKIEMYRNAIFHNRMIKNEEDAIFYAIKVLEAIHSE